MAKLLAWARTIIAKIRANPAAQTFMRVLASCLAFCGRHGFAAIAWLGLFAIAAFVWMVFEHREPIVKFAEAIGYADSDGMDGSTRFIRDTMIFGAGAFGIMVAIWRASVLGSQAKTAEKRLLNEQFANAVELMAKETTGANPKPAIAARTGGIYILADLATKKPKEFAEQVVKNLIAYIKENAQITAHPSLEEYQATDKEKPRTLGGDVKAAFSVLDDILGKNKGKEFIGKRFLDFSYQDFSGLDFLGIAIHHYGKWTRTDFQHCRLFGAHFKDADIRGVDFSNANMQRVTLENVDANSVIMMEADLRDAIMPKVNLSRVDLHGANLSHANLQSANLSGAKMHGTRMYMTNLNKIDDSAPADLSYASLYGASMRSIKLQGANMEWAYLWGVELTDAVLHNVNLASARFRGTCMVDVKIGKSELTKDIKATMNNKIIHKGYEALADEVDEIDDDFDWYLKEYPNSYALRGVLENFAHEFFNDMPGRLALRMQAWEMRDNEKMPEKWREWLEDINIETWEHPDDNPELDGDIPF